MAACRQLSQEVGHTFKAMPTSRATQYTNCNYESFQLATMAPITAYLDCGTTHTQLEGSSHSTGAFNNSLANGEEVNNLRIELQNLNAQHECAIQQLQDCRTQLQAAIEQKERYESFIVNAFLRMDDMETIIEGLREGWFKALGGCVEGYSIEESQSQSV
ncbi:hypothetical protein FBEOM_12074 [Fusarium beomiforme]|uniref:Uncharacterized protein n=1 Tax=Fusarium beomiforme TaxID=44412 RepID=A0A9P5A897_9HYPO|nr:hypothetical protein FBEOM_12074 [Fusarium beomiforme]